MEHNKDHNKMGFHLRLVYNRDFETYLYFIRGLIYK